MRHASWIIFGPNYITISTDSLLGRVVEFLPQANAFSLIFTSVDPFLYFLRDLYVPFYQWINYAEVECTCLDSGIKYQEIIKNELFIGSRARSSSGWCLERHRTIGRTMRRKMVRMARGGGNGEMRRRLRTKMTRKWKRNGRQGRDEGMTKTIRASGGKWPSIKGTNRKDGDRRLNRKNGHE